MKHSTIGVQDTRPGISRWRGWKSLAVVSFAVISTVVLMLIVDPILKIDLEREANGAKEMAKAILQNGIAENRAPRLELLLKLPQVKGVELFSPGGRRIAGKGEPLEIVGYRLDRDTVLYHASRDGSHQEIFWPPRSVESEFGVAVRLDISWFHKRRLSLIVAAAAVQLVALLAVAALFSWSFKRP